MLYCILIKYFRFANASNKVHSEKVTFEHFFQIAVAPLPGLVQRPHMAI
jgi:hypothetical protein